MTFWPLLDDALGLDVVIPVRFTPAVKSELGHAFLSIVESGRSQEYPPFDETFSRQLDKAVSEIDSCPSKLTRWGVPDGTRDSANGQIIHDDDLTTGALCTIINSLEWYTPLHRNVNS